jgi:hypothetical protein
MNRDRGTPTIQRLVGVMLVFGGLWHAAAPWIFRYSAVREAVASNIAAGLALAVVGIGFVIFGGGWLLNWIGAALGVWVLIAPQVLGATRPWLAPLEASWGGPIVLWLMIIAALDRWLARTKGEPGPA